MCIAVGYCDSAGLITRDVRDGNVIFPCKGGVLKIVKICAKGNLRVSKECMLTAISECSIKKHTK